MLTDRDTDIRLLIYKDYPRGLILLGQRKPKLFGPDLQSADVSVEFELCIVQICTPLFIPHIEVREIPEEMQTAE